MVLRCKFIVWPLNYCIYGTGLLTKTTINTFGHIYIVTSCSSTTVCSLFSFDCDCLLFKISFLKIFLLNNFNFSTYLSWTYSFAKLASNAPLLTTWISSQCMLTSKSWTQWALFEWIINSRWLDKKLTKRR